MRPTADQLAAVLDLYEQGNMTGAYTLAASYAPLKDWRGPAARVMAGRLANNVGSPHLGRVLHRLAYREDPTCPEAVYYAARDVAERRGAVEAWQFLRRHGELPGAAAELRADWFALHAAVLASVRDFDGADEWLARADDAVAAGKPWVQIERSNILAMRDRYDEALAAARGAMELRAWYRPAVHSIANLLVLIGRDDEALELLRDAASRLKVAGVVAQLAILETELGQHAAACQSWRRTEELSPLMEDGFRQFILAHRSDAAYYCGDFAEAVELGRAADTPFHKAAADKLAEALAQPADAPRRRRRVQLAVPFVRQHHMTCAPATLSALSRFWNMPAEHLEVAEEICYDGTPAHSERRWAETRGWRVREFTVTWDVAVRLIDRGVPFTLTTLDATSGHLQAVIGYDELRGTLLIRDPSERTVREFVAEPFFEHYAWTGPRGLALVPSERARLLDGDLSLGDDEPLFDDLHRVQLALAEHRRADAVAALAEMETRAPDYRLTLSARRAIAGYDANHVDALAVTDRLLAEHPNVPNIVLSKLSLLRVLGRREDRLALLKSASERPVDTDAASAGGQAASSSRARRTHRIPLPLFWAEYAQELRRDARERPTVLRLFRKALRYLRGEGWLYRELANVLWEARQREEATLLYRFAATVAPTDEDAARTYLIATRHFKRVNEALELMRARVAAAGKRSSHPARTLFWALEELDRTEEAFEVLDDALSRFGDEDGDLLLFAAEARGRYGRFEVAQQLLDRARGHCRPRAFLRVSAQVASFRGDAVAARESWRKVLEFEPLAMDAHQNLARLIGEADGHAAAVAHLATFAGRFPHNLPLHQLWATYLRDDGPAQQEPVVRALLAAHGDDGWARRELIQILTDTGRADEALAESELLIRTDPAAAASHFFRGKALLAAERRAEAREALKEAVRISVDADWAVHALIAACDGLPQQREALSFIHAELVRQTIFGDGLLAFRSRAADLWPPEEVLEKLREALAARPDLWHAWSAVVQQLAEMNQLDEAIATARDAVERFPLVPRLWFDLAIVERFRGDGNAEIAALRKALEISPGWAAVVRKLADAYERRGDFETSRELLAAAIARAPLDAENHGCLADALWKLGRRDEAIDRIGRAVELEPGYTWAWNALANWSREVGKPQHAVERARQLTQARAGEARSWMILARTLDQKQDLPERLEALDKAIALNPRFTGAIDLKANLLAAERRFDEAEAACRAPAFGNDALPLELRGRLAWIAAQRGDAKAAAAAMREVLRENANYHWGWHNLIEWCRAAGDKEGRLEAAAAMARLWPHDVSALESLGDARAAAEDRAGAKAAYARAIELEPSAEYAADLLFDLQLKDDELDAARRTIETLLRHHPDPRTKARQIKLACKADDQQTAAKVLAELCVTKCDGTWPLDAAVEAFRAVGWTPQLESSLQEALLKKEAQPEVAGRYAKLLATLGRWKDCEKFTDALGHAGERGEAATEAYLHQIAHKAASDPALARRLRRFVRRRSGVLRGRVSTWGTVAYALHTIRRYRDVVKWMSDWQQRDAAQGWMLVNYAESLRALGRDADAHPVNVRGLKISEGGAPRAIHSLWLAADALFADKWDDAQSYLAEPAIRSAEAPYRYMHTLLRNLLDILRSEAPRRTYATALKELRQAMRTYPKLARDREQARLYRRAMRLMAKRRIGAINRITCWCRSWQSRPAVR